MQSETGFRFDLQCPQCGAPAALGETEQIVDCPYCRVRHLAVSKPYPVSSIPPRSDLASGPVFYIPFWRFKGMVLALVRGRIAHRLVDTSRLGLAVPGLPVSLGLRSQTQSLRFVTPDLDGTLLRPSINKKTVLRNLGGRRLGLGPRLDPDELVQAYVGEALSLIYAPYVLKDGLLKDGLTGRTIDAAIREIEEAPGCAPPNTLSFLPALCPHCGWDLSGPRDSLVLPCQHCGRFWTPGRGRLLAVPCRCQAGSGEEILRLPFWEFQVQSPELSLTSYADLARLANLPRQGGEAMDNRPLIFRIPAFKINPALFLRLARQLTVFQPDSGEDPSPREESLFPVTLPAKEAFQALPLLLCRLTRDKQRLAASLKESQLKARSVHLHYLTFRRRGLELIHEAAGLSLQANALRFGRQL